MMVKQNQKIFFTQRKLKKKNNKNLKKIMITTINKYKNLKVMMEKINNKLK